mmetsp:Transcript_61334/g.155269  ORF Transcript_61334/g.155269 Transcript_61334/m.155269 type:complete len:323 (-) Transcript_61334:139-1107(-)
MSRPILQNILSNSQDQRRESSCVVEPMAAQSKVLESPALVYAPCWEFLGSCDAQIICQKMRRIITRPRRSTICSRCNSTVRKLSRSTPTETMLLCFFTPLKTSETHTVSLGRAACMSEYASSSCQHCPGAMVFSTGPAEDATSKAHFCTWLPMASMPAAMSNSSKRWSTPIFLMSGQRIRIDARRLLTKTVALSTVALSRAASCSKVIADNSAAPDLRTLPEFRGAVPDKLKLAVSNARMQGVEDCKLGLGLGSSSPSSESELPRHSPRVALWRSVSVWLSLPIAEKLEDRIKPYRVSHCLGAVKSLPVHRRERERGFKERC